MLCVRDVQCGEVCWTAVQHTNINASASVQSLRFNMARGTHISLRNMDMADIRTTTDIYSSHSPQAKGGTQQLPSSLTVKMCHSFQPREPNYTCMSISAEHLDANCSI